METLLAEQTTADDKMIPPTRWRLPDQPAGGWERHGGAVAVWR